jgi:hypothetical protein
MPLGNYPLTIRRTADQKWQVRDPIRRKFVALTPEEWVRQQLLAFLMTEKQFPEGLIAVERQLQCGNRFRRFDLLAFDNRHQPMILMECKAPDASLDDLVWMQAAMNNTAFGAPWLLLCNGATIVLSDLRTNPPTRFWGELPDYQYFSEQFRLCERI